MVCARLGVIAGALLLPVTAAWAGQGHDHAAMTAQAAAGEGAKDCAASSTALPPELAGWSGKRLRVKTVASTAKLASAVLPLGQAADAALLPTSKVVFAARPDKPGGSVSKSGMVRIDIPEAGRYRVALGAGPWVDVVRDGAALPSVAHGHGPDCSGIRKMVDYDLEAGSHVLQISGNGEAALAVMVVRMP